MKNVSTQFSFSNLFIIYTLSDKSITLTFAIRASSSKKTFLTCTDLQNFAVETKTGNQTQKSERSIFRTIFQDPVDLIMI